MAIEEENTNVSGLESALAADTSGEATAQMLRMLEDTAETVRSHMKGGLSPADYSSCDCMTEAMDCAKRVLGMAWMELHPGRTLSESL